MFKYFLVLIPNTFSEEIKEKQQLQRFLGCVNYIADFIPNIRIICSPLYARLRKNPPVWNDDMTKAIKQIKKIVKKITLSRNT